MPNALEKIEELAAGASEARDKALGLNSRRATHLQMRNKCRVEIEALEREQALAPKVTAALDQLCQGIMDEEIRPLERHLSAALQEVLEQPLELKLEPETRQNAAELELSILNNGKREDVQKAQGGSVANVLSVGLRMLALRMMDPKRHRPVLILDEPDCWLKPDRVPKLVKIIQEAGHALEQQTILISHHEVAFFQDAAARIIKLERNRDGSVLARTIAIAPTTPDAED